jgi:hypothetical protein
MNATWNKEGTFSPHPNHTSPSQKFNSDTSSATPQVGQTFKATMILLPAIPSGLRYEQAPGTQELDCNKET